MRIAFVTPTYFPASLGGSALVVKELAEEMAKRGNECTVFCFNRREARWLFPYRAKKFESSRETINGVTVRRLPAAWPLTASAHMTRSLFRKVGLRAPAGIEMASFGPWLMGLKSAFAREKFDVVHIEPFPYFVARQAANAADERSIPYVLIPSFHETGEGFDNPLLAEIARGAARVVTFTNVEANTVQRLGVPGEKIVVQACGIPAAERKDMVERDSSYPGKVVVLFAGARSEGKGVLALLEAARKLHERRKDILIIAIGPSTPAWDKAAMTGLPGNFMDLGFVTDEQKRRLFARCDIFAMPSKDESFGRVYAEAWQYGKPVIGCSIPVIREIIDDGQDGLLVPFADSAGLANAIERLADDPALRARMGEAGGNKTRSQFNNRSFHDVMEAAFVQASQHGSKGKNPSE